VINLSISISKLNQRAQNSRVALFIDANSARDFQTILKAYEYAQNYGRIVYASLYAEEKDLTLIGTMSSELSKKGIDIKVAIGPNEISIALDAMEFAYEKKADCIVICTRRESLVPVFKEIKKLDIKTILLAPMSIPAGLSDIADETHIL